MKLNVKLREAERNKKKKFFRGPLFFEPSISENSESLSELSLEHFDACCRTNCETCARTRSLRLASRTRALDTPTQVWHFGVWCDSEKEKDKRERRKEKRERERERP